MMNPDDFEAQLRQRTPPALPAAWRAEILAKANDARAALAVERPENRDATTARFHPAWKWGALAAAWAVIAALQLGSPAEPARAVAETAAPAQLERSLEERRVVVAELLGPPPPPAAPPTLPTPPWPPRSGCRGSHTATPLA